MTTPEQALETFRAAVADSDRANCNIVLYENDTEYFAGWDCPGAPLIVGWSFLFVDKKSGKLSELAPGDGALRMDNMTLVTVPPRVSGQ